VPRGKKYWPAHIKPDNYDVPGCNHPNADLTKLLMVLPAEYQHNLTKLLTATDNTYKDLHRDTGVTKLCLFSGLSCCSRLDILCGISRDLMHLASLNSTSILTNLWQGTIECHAPDSKNTWDWAVLQGDTWIVHGKAVADATLYLPGSFNWLPCDPTLKISSHYKAWEFLMWIFALGPSLLYGVLPDKYWQNYCKLVAVICIYHQHCITA
jgi:hypothetical protein